MTAGGLSPCRSAEATSLVHVQGNSISVERVINAPAGAIFALIADAGKHSTFDGSGTVDHTTAESIPLELGTTFSMRMRGRPETLFMAYTMNNKVIEFEQDRLIAWQPTTLGGLVGGRIWRYELSPIGAEGSATPGTGAEGSATFGTGGGTLVRETWDVSRDRQRLMLKMGSMPKQAEDGMRATLERLAAVLEQ
jgi:uncharacterized protein YndB with AHSA1/START domain